MDQQNAAHSTRQSPLSQEEIKKYRDQLRAKRRQLGEDRDSLMEEGREDRSRGAGDLSDYPNHPADRGSEEHENTLDFELAALENVRFEEVDAALGRIEDNTYGICEETGKPIEKQRLDLMPWTRVSIEGARKREG